jgi:hypothetical protein
MTRRQRGRTLSARLLAGGVVVAGVAAGTLGPADLAHGFLCLAPCLGLALLVAFERYAGERLIVSAATRRRASRRRASSVSVPCSPDRPRRLSGRLVGGHSGPRAPPLQVEFANCLLNELGKELM